MEHAAGPDPALTVALALAAGTVAQAVARKLGLPAIALLLAIGVVLGPEVTGAIAPSALGEGLFALVGFAVAVILFEGGMNLRLSRMQREHRAIRRLILVGSLVTTVGATLAARAFLGWSWSLSILFGTLVIVTGPTVIGPILKRLKVEHTTATVLEAEGVLIDAVGAIIAMVALEIALAPSGRSFAQGVLHVGAGLGLGSLAGAASGFALAFVLRYVPEDLRNVFTLGTVLALFHASNALIPESGIAAVTLAGVVIGNMHGHIGKELLEFKEQLTAMMIGMLFVLLAADVKLADVVALGDGGLWVVAALILVVRPLNVWISTFGTGLTWKQKAFIGWMGPRGIVAAAVASLFAVTLEANGIDGGRPLRALVFLVIAVTVAVAGLSGGVVARALSLRRKTDDGWVILGANELARTLARALMDTGQPVVCVDTNPTNCSAAEQEGLRVLLANGLEERTLHRAAIDTRAGAVGLSPNSEVNLMFAARTKAAGKLTRRLVGLGRNRARYGTDTAHESGARVLFGRAVDMDHWAVRVRRGNAEVQRWRWSGSRNGAVEEPLTAGSDDAMLPLVHLHRDGGAPVSSATRAMVGDEFIVLANKQRSKDVQAWMDLGWEQVSEYAPAQAEQAPPT